MSIPGVANSFRNVTKKMVSKEVEPLLQEVSERRLYNFLKMVQSLHPEGTSLITPRITKSVFEIYNIPLLETSFPFSRKYIEIALELNNAKVTKDTEQLLIHIANSLLSDTIAKLDRVLEKDNSYILKKSTIDSLGYVV